jgi:hypothetical protein
MPNKNALRRKLQRSRRTVQRLRKRLHDCLAELKAQRVAAIKEKNCELIKRINSRGRHDSQMPEEDDRCNICEGEIVWKYGADIFPDARYSAAESAYRMCCNCGSCSGQSVM